MRPRNFMDSIRVSAPIKDSIKQKLSLDHKDHGSTEADAREAAERVDEIEGVSASVIEGQKGFGLEVTYSLTSNEVRELVDIASGNVPILERRESMFDQAAPFVIKQLETMGYEAYHPQGEVHLVVKDTGLGFWEKRGIKDLVGSLCSDLGVKFQ
jgi:hypothetical protein